MGRAQHVAEMGYRTKPFHASRKRAGSPFRELLNIPDAHEVYFVNGGATLQFSAIPLNCLEVLSRARPRTICWAATGARRRATRPGYSGRLPRWQWIQRVFGITDGSTWQTGRKGTYFHSPLQAHGRALRFAISTSAPCDVSANLGSVPIDGSSMGCCTRRRKRKKFRPRAPAAASSARICYPTVRR